MGSQTETSTLTSVHQEYHKLSTADASSAWTSFCDAPTNVCNSSDRVVYVVGAPEKRATDILDIICAALRSYTKVKYRWWKEAPPEYDGKSSLNGEWVGYEPARGSFDVAQQSEAPATIVQYYYNGCNTAALVEKIFEGDLLLFESSSLIFPVAEYLFDPESCRNMMCSAYGQLYAVELSSKRCYVPMPISRLNRLTPGMLFQKGGALGTLGEMASDFEHMHKERTKGNIPLHWRPRDKPEARSNFLGWLSIFKLRDAKEGLKQSPDVTPE